MSTTHEIRFESGPPPRETLLDLYDAVGWTAYTNEPDGLIRAVANSTWVGTAWEGTGLVGLVRILSDDVSVMLLQDLLVRPTHQRRGIGRRLAAAALERFAHVRQRLLMTDDQPHQLRFYESLGYTNARTSDRLNLFFAFRST